MWKSIHEFIFFICLSTPTACTWDKTTHAFTSGRKSGLDKMSCNKRGVGKKALRLKCFVKSFPWHGCPVLDLFVTWIHFKVKKARSEKHSIFAYAAVVWTILCWTPGSKIFICQAPSQFTGHISFGIMLNLSFRTQNIPLFKAKFQPYLQPRTVLQARLLYGNCLHCTLWDFLSLH